MNHLMVDIETLGNKVNSVILSISAVQFNLETGEFGNEFHIEIEPQSCIDVGLEMDASTVMWWMGQSDEARKHIVYPEKPRLELGDALKRFNDWCALTFLGCDFFIWGNSARFDLGIVFNAMDKCFIKPCWNHRNERDVRTLVMFAPEIKDMLEFEGTKHYGPDDCKHQIRYCNEIYQLIAV